MASEPTPEHLLELLVSATERYRTHASRDAAWVQTWTGQPDPELLEIEETIEQLVHLELSSQQIVELLDRLLAERDEPLLAQALTERLLAETTHITTLHDALVAQIVTIVQDLSVEPPASTPWLGQLLFWRATAFEDLELCIALMGDDAAFLRALPFWLSTSHIAHDEHLFATHAEHAVRWLGEILERLDEERFEDADVLQGLALAMGMTRDERARPYVVRILTARHASVSSTPDAQLDEPDVAIAACLEALGVVGAKQAVSQALWCELLSSQAHGDEVAALLASDGECHVPMLSNLLVRTRQMPESMGSRVRAVRALKMMPESSAQANASLIECATDPMSPIRHMALYALIARRVEGTITRLATLLTDEPDWLEAEELLFILASHPEERAAQMIMELRHTGVAAGLDDALFEEALREQAKLRGLRSPC